jgi:hypothetical protein
MEEGGGNFGAQTLAAVNAGLFDRTHLKFCLQLVKEALTFAEKYETNRDRSPKRASPVASEHTTTNIDEAAPGFIEFLRKEGFGPFGAAGSQSFELVAKSIISHEKQKAAIQRMQERRRGDPFANSNPFPR